MCMPQTCATATKIAAASPCDHAKYEIEAIDVHAIYEMEALFVKRHLLPRGPQALDACITYDIEACEHTAHSRRRSKTKYDFKTLQP